MVAGSPHTNIDTTCDTPSKPGKPMAESKTRSTFFITPLNYTGSDFPRGICRTLGRARQNAFPAKAARVFACINLLTSNLSRLFRL